MPFYVYEFERTSGYAVPPHVIEELRSAAPNLAGMKVSDAPWERFQPYLIEGLDVFVGPEALIHAGHGRRGRRRGVGARHRVPRARARRRALRSASRPRAASAELRAAIEALPAPRRAQARAAQRGAWRSTRTCGAPLRGLTDDERGRLDELLPAWLEAPAVR